MYLYLIAEVVFLAINCVASYTALFQFILIEEIFKINFLKELPNHNRNFFCAHHKNRRKQNQYFERPYFMINLRPKCTTRFLICLKRNNSQNFKSSNCKKCFSPLCMSKTVTYVIGTTCFDKCCLFHVKTRRHSFL